MNSDLCETIFVGNSELGMLMRSIDWSQTPLGSVSGWTSSLKTSVGICLNSPLPMVIWWGQDLVLLYNDAWRPILGAKHPKALGRPGKEVGSEIWDMISVQLHSVIETAQATCSDDILVPVYRYGYTEEAYFTYSYSPIFLETGAVGGVFTAVTETTRRVIGERQLHTLRELAANTLAAKSVDQTCQLAIRTLADNPDDIPFALLYLAEQNGQKARLVETVRLEPGTPAIPEQIDLTTEQDGWQLFQVKQTRKPQRIDELISRWGILAGGDGDEPSRSAIALPIIQFGQKEQLAGLLVLGISPRREFDDEYQGFFELVASNIATAIANAQAYQTEQRRATALAKQASVSEEEFGEPLPEDLKVGSEPATDGTEARCLDISDVYNELRLRQQVEIALRQSEQKLRLALTAARMVAWTWNASTNQIIRSETACEILGLTPAAVNGSGAQGWQLVHPDDLSMHQEKVAEAIANRSSYTSEFRIIRPDNGAVIWVQDRGQVTYDEQGNVFSIEGIIFDISDRKQTEQALRDAEERLRVALQNSPITVFNQDRELKYTWIYNPVLYEVEKMLGKCDRDFLPPEGAEPLTAIKQRVLDTGIGTREEIKITREGIDYYYDLTVEPLRDANHTIIGITGAAVDVSELKRTEISLRESEARFRGVVESNMVGILFWDASGCITDGNEMAVKMLGYNQEELRSGQIRWQNITPWEFHELDAAMQAQILAQGSCPPFEKAYIRKDGTQIPVLIGGALLPGYSDRGVAYFIDITERKQAEQEREYLLQREQAAREAAEAANRIKDEFLAVISHELRSPLNPILGWAKILRTHSVDAQKTDYALQVIERNAQMQAQLINDLLDVSRILRGKLSLDDNPVDLVVTIQSAMETVRLAAEAKSMQIYSQLDPQVGYVAGDADRLQ